MKNSIKIVTIAGIITSFFSVYPMTEGACYSTVIFELSKIKLPKDMEKLNIWRRSRDFILGPKIKNSHPIYEDGGLALSLTAAKFFADKFSPGKDLEKWDEDESKQILKRIYDAVSEGTSVISNYAVETNDRLVFKIFSSQSPISIFTVIENLAKRKKYSLDMFGNLVGKKRRLIKAIFQGHCNRQKELVCMGNRLIDYLRGGLGIEVPRDLTFLIVSYLPEYYINKESRALIKEAEQKFNEEQ